METAHCLFDEGCKFIREGDSNACKGGCALPCQASKVCFYLGDYSTADYAAGGPYYLLPLPGDQGRCRPAAPKAQQRPTTASQPVSRRNLQRGGSGVTLAVRHHRLTCAQPDHQST